MFLVHTVQDTIRIAADTLASNTVVSIQNEIDKKYPNRVLMDVGLVIGRYDNINDGERRKHEQRKIQHRSQRNIISSSSSMANKRQRTVAGRRNDNRLLLPECDGGLVRISHGVCVTGDSGSHYDCTFQLIVFRPFVNEVCVGIIERSSHDGIHVSVGFFRNIFIPAYWMLNPSQYDPQKCVWVWTPEYTDENEEANPDENAAAVQIKAEDISGGGVTATTSTTEETAESSNRYEMDIGSEIRFKVKSINFTQITNTAKGMQATTISMGSHSSSATDGKGGGTGTSSGVGATTSSATVDDGGPILRRRRSSSVSGNDESAARTLPSAMQVVASICEDGLGLTSWWTTSIEEEEEENSNTGEEEEDIVAGANGDIDANQYGEEDYYNYEGGEYYE